MFINNGGIKYFGKEKEEAHCRERGRVKILKIRLRGVTGLTVNIGSANNHKILRKLVMREEEVGWREIGGRERVGRGKLEGIRGLNFESANYYNIFWTLDRLMERSKPES